MTQRGCRSRCVPVMLISNPSDSPVGQIRTVFIIDPKKTIRLLIAYPASTGRNFDEIIR